MSGRCFEVFDTDDYGDFRVRFYENGNYLENEDYLTTDKGDAIGTGEWWLFNN